MDLDKLMDRTLSLIEESLKSKQKSNEAEARRLTAIAMEQEKTKRMGLSAQETLQNLVNKGLIDRQELENTGQMNRKQIEEAGLDRRQGRELDFKRNEPVFKEFKTKTTDMAGGEKETSEWRNVNTAGGKLNGQDGGALDPADIDFFSKTTPEKSKAVETPTRTLADQVSTTAPKDDRLPIDSQTPVEALPRGTGYLQTEGGRTLEVRGNNITEVPQAMPTRGHDLTAPEMQSSHTPFNPDMPRTLQNSHAPLTRPNSGYGEVLPGGGQSFLDQNGQRPRAFGESFIRSNLGHALGADKALNIANGFNRTLTGGWGLSSQLGNAMIERGIKPAVRWATQEYNDPYQRKLY